MALLYFTAHAFHQWDIRLLVSLNHYLMANPGAWKAAYFAADHGGEVLTVIVGLTLWFWSESKKRRGALLQPVRLDGRSAPKFESVRNHKNDAREPMTQRESRAQLLVLGTAGLLAYISARLIALSFDVPRPFTTNIGIKGPPGLFDSLRTFGSFPSDHAALLGLLAVGVGFWSLRLLVPVSLGCAVALASRTGIGFHFPSDTLAGALLGASFALAALSLYRRSAKWQEISQTLARNFEPKSGLACIGAYGLLFVLGVEFSMHFRHVFDFIFYLRGAFFAA